MSDEAFSQAYQSLCWVMGEERVRKLSARHRAMLLAEEMRWIQESADPKPSHVSDSNPPAAKEDVVPFRRAPSKVRSL